MNSSEELEGKLQELRLMSLARDESLTLQERAEQAQSVYSQMTETAAVAQRAQESESSSR